MTTKQPSGADALTRLMQLRSQARREGRALGVRVTQAGGYVGVLLRPPPPLTDYPVGAGWLELFAAGRRDAGKMAREACHREGVRYAHQGKYDKRVKAELRALGKEHLWQVAKVKSGRPPARRS